MKKTLLFISCLSLSAFGYSATIENRNLSTPTANNSTVDQNQQNMQIWELKQQIQQLQTQVRQLVGKIEEKEYQFEQLNNELENRYKDLDQRLEILNEQLNPTEKENAEDASSETSSTEAITESNNQTKTPIVLSDTNPVNVSTGSDQDAYNLAYEAYQKGGAAEAIQPMQNLIDSFPNSPYVSHAHYWLGEFNLKLDPPKIHEARANFEVVYGNYPKSNKAPAALYRLVEIALNIDKDVNKARGYYQKLIQEFPDSQETKTARSTFGL